MKLRTKIAISITTLVVVILILVASLTLHLVSRELHLGVDQALALSATQLVAMAEVEDGRLHLEERDDGHMVAPLGEDDLLRLVSVNGTVVDSRGRRDVPVDASQFSDNLDYQTVNQSNAGDTIELRIATIPVYDDTNGSRNLIAYLQVGKSLSATNQTVSQIERLFVVLLPACFLFAAIASYFLADQALAPIEKIRLEASRASVDRLDKGISTHGLPDDEVGRLARTFDEMLRRLGTSFFRQRRFTADASHELRTPVSNMRGVAEVALSKPRTEDEYRTALLTILDETKSMTRLIDLLFLARSDSDRLHLEREVVDLQEVLSAFGDNFSDGNLELQLDAPIHVFVDKDRFLQVMFNLLENCSTHASDSDVLVSGKVVQGKLQLMVSDSGPGIEPQHLVHITERFYRVDPARTRQSTSSGLGLSIALEIMEAHGGRLWVESEAGQGTQVYLEVPTRDTTQA